MTTSVDLQKQLQALLGASAKFYPGRTPQTNDYYEAYLWAETVAIARSEHWTVTFVNAGAKNDEFKFRMGPGRLNSSVKYTYANLSDSTGRREGELHLGVRVRGLSGILHEFDVVALTRLGASIARKSKKDPSHDITRLHIEAKFHKNDLSLGVGRSLVGLKVECPSVHPFLVSRAAGSQKLRDLIKHYHGSYVHAAFPTGSGVAYLHTCLKTALGTWKP